MAGKLSFAVAINLLTENFNKGTNQIKAGFRNIQMQAMAMVAAFGMGSIGLSNFVSSLIETARETNRVQTALKNVSASSGDYVKNQKFLIGISQKYGVYINDLVGGFSKFTAAASAANVSMSDQQSIFESVSRACVGFGLSAEDTNFAFLAITQMMGKGKIQAEELRGQLGERLPVAMQAMAKAAGTTVAGLDKIMKAGKLMSADVLPKFAKALNEMLPSVNTDNVETSFNRLKNSFKELTDKLKVGGIYKSLLDQSSSTFSWILNNLSFVGRSILSLVTGVIIGKAFSLIKSSFNDVASKAEASFIRQEIAARKLTLTRELENSTLTKKEQAAYKAQELAATESFAKQEFQAKKSSLVIAAAFKTVGIALKTVFTSFAPILIISAVTSIIAKFVEWSRNAKEIANILKTNKDSYSLFTGDNEESNNLKSVFKIYSDTTKTIIDRKNALNELNGLLGTNYNFNLNDLELQGKINSKYLERIDLISKQARASYIAGKQVETDDQIRVAKEEQAKAQQQYNKYNWKTGTKIDGIHTPFVGKNLDQANDKVNALVSTKSFYDEEAIKNKIDLYNSTKKTSLTGGNTDSGKKDEIQKTEDEYLKSIKELNNQKQNQIISDKKYKETLDKLNTDTYKKLGGLLTKDQTKTNKVYQASKLGSKSEIDTLESEYNKTLEDLTNQNKSGLLNSKQYDDAKNDLIDSTLKSAVSLEGIDPATNEFIKSLKTNKRSEINNLESEYNKSLQDLINENKFGIISDTELNNEKSNLTDSTLKTAVSLEGIDPATNEFIKGLIKGKKELDTINGKNFVFPKLEKVDNTFDYKKTDPEKQQDKINVNDKNIDLLTSELEKGGIDNIQQKIKESKGNLEKLKSQFNDDGDKMIDSLNEKLNNVTSLSDALKILQVKEDVKSLKKQLSTGLYDGVKDIAGSAKNMYEAFKAVKETINDVDSSGWEKFLSIWDAITNTVDSILSVCNTIEALTKLTKELGKAKQQEQLIDNLVTSQKVTNAGVSAGAAVASAVTTETAAVGQVAANTAVAGSGAAASVSSIPIVGPILAIAAIAAVIGGIVSMIPKFETGGIIGGGSISGDKILARVNSGEMILNQGQQSNLFGMLNGRGGTNSNSINNGGSVEFRIEGKALKGVLTNYDKIKSKVK